MRLLLGAGQQPFEEDLTRALRGMGHTVIGTTSRGMELIPAIERAGRLHAAVLGQAMLGSEWVVLLRHLRGRFPRLPVVILLSPGAERTWRRALLAGAFDALRASTPVEGALKAVCLALSCCWRVPYPERSAPGTAAGPRRVPLVGAEDLGAPCVPWGPGGREDMERAIEDRIPLCAASPDPGTAPGGLWAVVLAGGEGTRLQRFVRQVLGSERPKQFCSILGTRSMLRHTWDRADRVVKSDRIVTVITAGQEPYLEEEARRGVPGTVLVQPANRETAPGLLVPLLWIAHRAPGATVAVFPADHFIWEEALFAAHVRAAVAVAQRTPDRLTLLGVEADGPEVGYGWIAPGAPLEAGPGIELHAVRRFWEKPDPRTAQRLFRSGCLWNTLVLAGRLGAYLALAEACVPEVLTPLRAIAASLGTPGGTGALRQAYCQIPRTNLSRAILARRPGTLAVLAARGVSWSDWGDADRILRTLHRFGRKPRWFSVRPGPGARWT